MSGGFGQNPYLSKPLPGQVSSGFTDAMGGASDIYKTGMDALGTANEDLSSTDMSKWMNPFITGVINPTMSEFDRQHELDARDLSDRATKAGSYGGDRFGIESAALTRDTEKQKTDFLANLNKTGFDTANATRLAEAGQLGTTGAGLAAGGNSALSNMVNIGFGMGDTMQKNQLAAGQMKSDLMQKIIDAAKKDYSGTTGQGATALETLLNSIKDPGGAGTSTSSSNPGMLGILGGMVSLLGAL